MVAVGDGFAVGFDEGLVGAGVGAEVCLIGAGDRGFPWVGSGAAWLGADAPDPGPIPGAPAGGADPLAAAIPLPTAACERPGCGWPACGEPIGTPRPVPGDTAPVGAPLPCVRVVVLCDPEVSAFPTMTAAATAAIPPPAQAITARLRRAVRRTDRPRTRWSPNCSGSVIARSGPVSARGPR